MLRLFLALELPERIRLAIFAAAERARDELSLGSPSSKLSWVPAGNYHFTLKFLGSVPEGDIEAVRAAVSAVVAGCGVFRFRVRGAGAFPSAERASVLWVGADDSEGRIASLAKRLDAALEPLGFASEDRPYVPHLTIARVKAGRVDPTPLAKAARLDLGEVEARELALMRSRALPTGSVYERLVAFPLA